MEFDNSFTVQKPIDEVWNTMTDLERVVPCVPDARVIEKTGDRAVRAEVKIKLGAMTMNYSTAARSSNRMTPGIDRDECSREEGRRAGQRRQGLDAWLAQRQHRGRASLTDQRHGQGGADGRGSDRGGDRGMIKEFSENLAKL